jgi:hypothetical protein
LLIELWKKDFERWGKSKCAAGALACVRESSSFDFAEAIENTALPKKVRWGKI